jgi:hypothetical protein
MVAVIMFKRGYHLTEEGKIIIAKLENSMNYSRYTTYIKTPG